MKNLLIKIFLFLPFFAFAQDYTIANWFNDKSSATVLTFDDWSPGHGTIVAPLLIAKKLTGTFFVNEKTSSLGGGYWAMTNAFNHGIEIANHSATHPDLTTLTPEDLETEVNGNKATLELNIPQLKVFTFAYPFGAANQMVKNKVMEKHIAARGVYTPALWDYSLNTINNTYDNLGTVAVSPALSSATFTNFVKAGIHDGGLITFMFHSVYNASVDDHWYNAIDESLLSQYLDSLKIYENQTWVTTLRDAIKYHTEKKSAELFMLNQNDSLWTLNLNDKLADSIYNYPLTVKLKIVEGKQVSFIVQGDDTLAYHMKADTIVFNSVPNGSNIFIALADYNPFNSLNPFIYNVHIYNNPLTGTFVCAASSNRSFLATIIIYDLNGNSVQTLNSVNFKKGENKIPVNISNLAVGNYLVSISGEGFSETYRVDRK